MVRYKVEVVECYTSHLNTIQCVANEMMATVHLVMKETGRSETAVEQVSEYQDRMWVYKRGEELLIDVVCALVSTEIYKAISNPSLGKDVLWVGRVELKFFPQVIDIQP